MSKKRLTLLPDENAYEVFDRMEDFQRAIDTVFLDIFGVPNRTANGAFVSGKRTKDLPRVFQQDDQSPKHYMSAIQVYDHVYVDTISLDTMHSWYDAIRGRLQGEETEANIRELLQRDTLPHIAHEIQHLGFYSLADEQKEMVVTEVLDRIPLRRNTLSSREQTADELLSEARRLYELEFDNHSGGYLNEEDGGAKSTPEMFDALSPIFPIMHELVRNYADFRGIPVRDVFHTGHKFPDGVRTVRSYSGGPETTVTKIPDAAPFSLPDAV